MFWRSGLGLLKRKFDSYQPVISPYFHLWMMALVNINEVSPNLVCTLILWISGLGVKAGKFR